MPIFLKLFQFLISGLTTGSTYALIAIGFSIIHNATGIVNFAQGEFVMLGGMFMITFFTVLKIPMASAFCLTVISVAIVGLILEKGPLEQARSKEILNLVMITVAASIVIKGLTMILWGKNSMTIPAISGESPLLIWKAAIMPQSLWIFGVTLGAVAMLNVFFRCTRTGKAIRAVSANRRYAVLAGIPVNRMLAFSFCLSAALGAVAGILLTPMTTISYDAGVMLGLKGFSAAILGGYGSMTGAVIGGILLGVMESLGAGFISSEYKDVLAFMILLMVLFIKPSGLLGAGMLKRV